MDNTRNKILEAAAYLFTQKGFSGISISDIAKEAGINQSLIYHHIGNKQELWVAVKDYLINNIVIEEINYKNLEEFISYIINSRINIYEKDPRILRLIQWQMLESTTALKSDNIFSPSKWEEQIKKLQDSHQIRTDYSANILAVYIHSLINGLLFDLFKIFEKDKKVKELYIKFIKEEILKALKITSKENLI